MFFEPFPTDDAHIDPVSFLKMFSSVALGKQISIKSLMIYIRLSWVENKNTMWEKQSPRDKAAAAFQNKSLFVAVDSDVIHHDTRGSHLIPLKDGVDDV